MLAKIEPGAIGVTPEEEQRMMDHEILERMPLESLLYYVLAGEGRKKSAAVRG